jgi:hypothetical protein
LPWVKLLRPCVPLHLRFAKSDALTDSFSRGVINIKCCHKTCNIRT